MKDVRNETRQSSVADTTLVGILTGSPNDLPIVVKASDNYFAPTKSTRLFLAQAASS